MENTTEEDWNDVRLTLVSGRPISFLMDLYQPLYVQRPMVQPELYGSLGPVVYGQDLSSANQEFGRLARSRRRDRQDDLSAGMGMGGGIGGMPGRTRGGAGYGRPGGEFAYLDEEEMVEEAPSRRLGEDLARTAPAAAQTADIGELFQYVIESPVDLPRQQSALLPIVNAGIEAKKVSIYNQQVQAKHPLNGLKLRNTTDLHLMQGPITVFDGGVYAGDAQIADLQPDTERLISYALDLDVEVAPQASVAPESLVKVSVIKGVLQLEHLQSRQQKFQVKNSAAQPRSLLIEHPLDSQWRLVSPKAPAEKTRDLYRFALTAEPGKPAQLAVVEEQTLRKEMAITDLDDDGVLLYRNAKQSSPKVQNALQEVIRRRQEVATLTERHNQLQGEANEIGRDQMRIRQNMAQLGRDTDLYRRYVKTFGEQEDRLEKLRAEIEGQQEQEAALRKALDDYLIALDAE